MASPPPSPEHSKKDHIAFPDNSQKIPSKSCSNSICKTLIVLALLLLIPFFPSQAPDFIGQKVSTQFWEIVHLLFIGIAVSYGVFGRRSAQKIEISTVDDDSHSYLSGISHLSSIFEDGLGNTRCGIDEQEPDLMQSYYANCNSQSSVDPILGQSGGVDHGGSCIGTKIQSLVSNNLREDIVDEKNVKKNQTWSSMYSKGESLVVVAGGDSSDFKPLNLPVRSLRSNVVDSDKSDSSLKNEVKGRKKTKARKIRGMVPMNSENRFKDPEGLSPIPWRSRSVRMENEEEELNGNKPHVHCRPHSVGDIEFERIVSRPSNDVQVFSTSPELQTLRMEDAKAKNVISVPCLNIAPLTGFVDRNCEENKEVVKGKQPIEPLEADAKPSAFGKALPRRAKSVRTVKPVKDIVTNQKTENSFANRQHEEVDHHFSMPKPKPKLPDFFKDEDSVDITDESEEDRVSEMKESSDEEEKEVDAKTNIDYDLGSEVDRKAGEFIAKFREQIRRQKASSVKGLSQEFL